jgi:hypothetical protein
LAELTKHLAACLGEPAPWHYRLRTDNPPITLTLELNVLAGLGRDEFEIDARADEIVLRASTVPALEHAVHFFLEQAFGVRWLWPGGTGAVTPRAQDVRWPAGLTRHRPSFHWRRLWLGGAFWMEDDPYLTELKYGGVPAERMDELAQWHRRQRLGGLNIADGHRWAEICSPLEYAKDHPEYFALINGERDTHYHDGKHGNHPCTSNPAVVKLVADYIKAQFRARPELDGFSIATNDGLGFCECPNCTKIDDEVSADEHRDQTIDFLTNEVASPANVAGKRAITDRMLRFANAVAEEIEKINPAYVAGPAATTVAR